MLGPDEVRLTPKRLVVRHSPNTTDSGADTVDAITGSFTPGTAYTAVTPYNANSAPSTCSTLNSLGTINLKTGAVGNVVVTGPVQPKGMISSRTRHDPTRRGPPAPLAAPVPIRTASDGRAALARPHGRSQSWAA